MTTLAPTDKQLTAGVKRMHRLQKTALRKDHYLVLPGTFAKEAAALRRGLPHWHAHNILAAVVYPVEEGWNADLVLRDAPDGHSLVLDKGQGQPFASKKQAENFLLCFVTALTAAWAPEVVLPHPCAHHQRSKPTSGLHA